MFELHTRLQADTQLLGDLPLCRVLLAKDSQYPWLILVPRVDNLREIHHLAPAQQQQLMQESCAVATLMDMPSARTRSTSGRWAIWCRNCICTMSPASPRTKPGPAPSGGLTPLCHMTRRPCGPKPIAGVPGLPIWPVSSRFALIIESSERRLAISELKPRYLLELWYR